MNFSKSVDNSFINHSQNSPQVRSKNPLVVITNIFWTILSYLAHVFTRIGHCFLKRKVRVEQEPRLSFGDRLKPSAIIANTLLSQDEKEIKAQEPALPIPAKEEDRKKEAASEIRRTLLGDPSLIPVEVEEAEAKELTAPKMPSKITHAILGDPHIASMELDGQSLEGANIDQLFPSVLHVLKTHPELDSQRSLRHALRQILEVSNWMATGEDAFVKNMVELLTKLPVGASITIDGGWNKHKMFYRFIKYQEKQETFFSLIVFNKGAGCNYHHVNERGRQRLISPVFVLQKIPEENLYLPEFWSYYFKFGPTAKREDRASEETIYGGWLEAIQLDPAKKQLEWRTLAEEFRVEWTPPQRSGNCVFSSFEELSKWLLPKKEHEQLLQALAEQGVLSLEEDSKLRAEGERKEEMGKEKESSFLHEAGVLCLRESHFTQAVSATCKRIDSGSIKDAEISRIGDFFNSAAAKMQECITQAKGHVSAKRCLSTLPLEFTSRVTIEKIARDPSCEEIGRLPAPVAPYQEGILWPDRADEVVNWLKTQKDKLIEIETKSKEAINKNMFIDINYYTPYLFAKEVLKNIPLEPKYWGELDVKARQECASLLVEFTKHLTATAHKSFHPTLQTIYVVHAVFAMVSHLLLPILQEQTKCKLKLNGEWMTHVGSAQSPYAMVEDVGALRQLQGARSLLQGWVLDEEGLWSIEYLKSCLNGTTLFSIRNASLEEASEKVAHGQVLCAIDYAYAYLEQHPIVKKRVEEAIMEARKEFLSQYEGRIRKYIKNPGRYFDLSPLTTDKFLFKTRVDSVVGEKWWEIWKEPIEKAKKAGSYTEENFSLWMKSLGDQWDKLIPISLFTIAYFLYDPSFLPKEYQILQAQAILTQAFCMGSMHINALIDVPTKLEIREKGVVNGRLDANCASQFPEDDSPEKRLRTLFYPYNNPSQPLHSLEQLYAKKRLRSDNEVMCIQLPDRNDKLRGLLRFNHASTLQIFDVIHHFQTKEMLSLRNPHMQITLEALIFENDSLEKQLMTVKGLHRKLIDFIQSGVNLCFQNKDLSTCLFFLYLGSRLQRYVDSLIEHHKGKELLFTEKFPGLIEATDHWLAQVSKVEQQDLTRILLERQAHRARHKVIRDVENCKQAVGDLILLSTYSRYTSKVKEEESYQAQFQIYNYLSALLQSKQGKVAGEEILDFALSKLGICIEGSWKFDAEKQVAEKGEYRIFLPTCQVFKGNRLTPVYASPPENLSRTLVSLFDTLFKNFQREKVENLISNDQEASFTYLGVSYTAYQNDYHWYLRRHFENPETGDKEEYEFDDQIKLPSDVSFCSYWYSVHAKEEHALLVNQEGQALYKYTPQQGIVSLCPPLKGGILVPREEQAIYTRFLSIDSTARIWRQENSVRFIELPQFNMILELKPQPSGKVVWEVIQSTLYKGCLLEEEQSLFGLDRTPWHLILRKGEGRLVVFSRQLAIQENGFNDYVRPFQVKENLPIEQTTYEYHLSESGRVKYCGEELAPLYYLAYCYLIQREYLQAYQVFSTPDVIKASAYTKQEMEILDAIVKSSDSTPLACALRLKVWNLFLRNCKENPAKCIAIDTKISNKYISKDLELYVTFEKQEVGQLALSTQELAALFEYCGNEASISAPLSRRDLLFYWGGLSTIGLIQSCFRNLKEKAVTKEEWESKEVPRILQKCRDPEQQKQVLAKCSDEETPNDEDIVVLYYIAREGNPLMQARLRASLLPCVALHHRIGTKGRYNVGLWLIHDYEKREELPSTEMLLKNPDRSLPKNSSRRNKSMQLSLHAENRKQLAQELLALKGKPALQPKPIPMAPSSFSFPPLFLEEPEKKEEAERKVVMEGTALLKDSAASQLLAIWQQMIHSVRGLISKRPLKSGDAPSFQALREKLEADTKCEVSKKLFEQIQVDAGHAIKQLDKAYAWEADAKRAEEVIAELDQAIPQATKELKAMRRSLMELAWTKPRDREAAIREDLDRLADRTRKIQFKELRWLYLQRDITLYQKRNPSLTSADCAKLQESMERYLLSRRAIQQLQRLRKELKEWQQVKHKELHVEPIVQALTAYRPHDSQTSSRSFLLTECLFDLTIREDQVQNIQKLCRTEAEDKEFPKKRRFLQSLMGRGKTRILAPLTALEMADGERLSVLVVPKDLMPEVEDCMRHRLGFATRVRRLDLSGKSSAKLICNELQEMITERQVLLMTPDELHLIDLNERRAVHDYASHRGNSENMKWWTTVGDLLQNKAHLLIDEVQKSLDPQKDVRITLPGDELVLSARERELIRLCQEGLEQNKKVFFECTRSSQGALFVPERDFVLLKQFAIKHVLAHHSLLKEQEWKEKEQKAITNFLEAPAEQQIAVPQFLIPAVASLLCTLRGLLFNLEFTLQQVPGVRFGFYAKNGRTQWLPCPYEGANRPRPRSQFADHLALAAYALHIYRDKGFPKDLWKLEIERRRKGYLEELGQAPFRKTKDTAAYAALADLIGKANSKVCPEAIECLEQELSPAQLDAMIERLSQNPAMLYRLVEWLVLPHVKRQLSMLISTSNDLLGNCQEACGFTATLDEGILPHHYRTIPEEGSTATPLVLFHKQNHTTHSLKATAPLEIIQELLSPEHLARHPFRALIDLGVKFKGIPNAEVAQMVLNTLPKQFHCVLFWEESKAVGVLRNGQMVPASELSSIPLEHCFTYYSNTECTGFERRHLPTAHAWMTFHRLDTYDSVAQAAYRMRGLAQRQEIHLVLDPATEQFIRSKQKISADQPLYTVDAALFALRTQGEEQARSHLTATHNEIRHVIQQRYKRLLRKIGQKQPPSLVELDILTKLAPLLVSKIDFDPIKAYGQVKKEEDRVTALKAFATSLLKKRKRFYESLPKEGQELIAKMEENEESLEKQIEAIISDAAQRRRVPQKILSGQSLVDANSSVEVEQQQEVQVEVEAKTHAEGPRARAQIEDAAVSENNLDLRMLDYSAYLQPLRGVPQMFGAAHRENVELFRKSQKGAQPLLHPSDFIRLGLGFHFPAERFCPNFHATFDLLYSRKRGLPFDELQKPLKHGLLLQNLADPRQIHFILLASHEAQLCLEKLAGVPEPKREFRACLIDSSGARIQYHAEDREYWEKAEKAEEDWEGYEPLQQCMVQWAYLSGDYLQLSSPKMRKHLSAWVAKFDKEKEIPELQELFTKIVARQEGCVRAEWEKLFS